MRSGFIEIDGQNIALFVGLYASVFNAAPRNDRWTEDAVRERFEAFVRFPGFYGLGHMTDSSPAAMVFGWKERWMEGWHFHLKEMCVATALQRQGIGSMLLEELESRLAGHGVHRVLLETGEATPARRFYEASGYRRFRLVSLRKSLEAQPESNEPGS
jgi:ribosomal protein S18 acetylase RimI-like enzyme